MSYRDMTCQSCKEMFEGLFRCNECGAEVCWNCGHYDGTCNLCADG